MYPDTYDLLEKETPHELRFFFVSKGKKDITKVVAYSYIQKFGSQKVYNLGFGDYDISNDRLRDDTFSDNGDVYRVFRTVLSTIPLFFIRKPLSMLMVQGSDSTPGFPEHCRPTCSRGCSDTCKKFNRRISVYRKYVNTHYDELRKEYIFYGGRKNGPNKILVEHYEPEENYEAILFESNFVTSGIVSEPQEPISMKKEIKAPASLSEAEWLVKVADKLQDRVLFPRLVENAKKLLKNAEFVSK